MVKEKKTEIRQENAMKIVTYAKELNDNSLEDQKIVCRAYYILKTLNNSKKDR